MTDLDKKGLGEDGINGDTQGVFDGAIESTKGSMSEIIIMCRKEGIAGVSGDQEIKEFLLGISPLKLLDDTVLTHELSNGAISNMPEEDLCNSRTIIKDSDGNYFFAGNAALEECEKQGFRLPTREEAESKDFIDELMGSIKLGQITYIIDKEWLNQGWGRHDSENFNVHESSERAGFWTSSSETKGNLFKKDSYDSKNSFFRDECLNVSKSDYALPVVFIKE